jgi:hypothetical protein
MGSGDVTEIAAMYRAEIERLRTSATTQGGGEGPEHRGGKVQ